MKATYTRKTVIQTAISKDTVYDYNGKIVVKHKIGDRKPFQHTFRYATYEDVVAMNIPQSIPYTVTETFNFF